MHTAIRDGLGVGLIILGIIGIFVPILQGILFIVLGVGLLRSHNVKGGLNRLSFASLKKKFT